MTADEHLAHIRAVLTLGDGFNDYGDLWQAIWWRTDDEYAPVTFFVNCNDLFWWATADSETLTPENLPMLTRAIADVREALGVPTTPTKEQVLDGDYWDKWYDAGGQGAELFCARVREMRPQRPCYRTMPEVLKPLFDACGPERDRASEG